MAMEMLSPLLRCPTEIQQQIFDLVMDVFVRIEVNDRFHRSESQERSMDHNSEYMKHYDFNFKDGKDQMLNAHLAYMNLCRTLRPIARKAYFQNNIFVPVRIIDTWGYEPVDFLWRPLFMVEKTALRFVRSIYLERQHTYPDSAEILPLYLQPIDQFNSFEALRTLGVHASDVQSLEYLRGNFGILKASTIILNIDQPNRDGFWHKDHHQRTFDLSSQDDVRTAAGAFFGLTTSQKIHVCVHGCPGYVQYLGGISARSGSAAYFSFLNSTESSEPFDWGVVRTAIINYEEAARGGIERLNRMKQLESSKRSEMAQVEDLAESRWLWASDPCVDTEESAVDPAIDASSNDDGHEL